jgi:acetylornithine deacetylase/succinyl-diaminopimelate desuccinylase-like protein
LTSTESRVLDRLDFPAMVRFLSDLVRIPSVSGEESTAQRCVGEWMRCAGRDVDLWDLDIPALSCWRWRTNGTRFV